MTRSSKQRTSSEMYPLIEQWQESGQKKAHFCAAHQIKLHTFSYWEQKYRKQTEKVNAGFVRLEITPPADSLQRGLELVHPSGVKLLFATLPAPVYLAGLLKELGQ